MGFPYCVLVFSLLSAVSSPSVAAKLSLPDALGSSPDALSEKSVISCTVRSEWEPEGELVGVGTTVGSSWV
ncbi:hypothetical protein BX667DRAFT_501659 [Coemansia mojavensis]|nr:hypothetical protein BX667DRAFT_501659 [Coemansia mojavensis]